MKLLKNKSIVSYVSLILPVLAIVLTIVGGTTLGLVGDSFPAVIIVSLVLGAVANIVCFLLPKYDFLQIIAAAFYGVALGFIVRYGVEVLAYAMQNVDVYVGGDASLVKAYFALGLILLVLSIASAFFTHAKAEK